ncbi:MAG: hypothetical protein AAFN74_10320 [Myxococcota bacterium]
MSEEDPRNTLRRVAALAALPPGPALEAAVEDVHRLLAHIDRLHAVDTTRISPTFQIPEPDALNVDAEASLPQAEAPLAVQQYLRAWPDADGDALRVPAPAPQRTTTASAPPDTHLGQPTADAHESLESSESSELPDAK